MAANFAGVAAKSLSASSKSEYKSMFWEEGSFMYSVSELLEAIREMSPEELQLLSEAIQEIFSVTVREPETNYPYTFWQYYYMGGYSVILNEAGPNKVKVIKLLREFRCQSLTEAKELVEHKLPAYVKENCKKDEAYNLREQFEAVGAVVTLEGGYVYDPLPNGYMYD